jgi:hypothetical protein
VNVALTAHNVHLSYAMQRTFAYTQAHEASELLCISRDELHLIFKQFPAEHERYDLRPPAPGRSLIIRSAYMYPWKHLTRVYVHTHWTRSMSEFVRVHVDVHECMHARIRVRLLACMCGALASGSPVERWMCVPRMCALVSDPIGAARYVFYSPCAGASRLRLLLSQLARSEAESRGCCRRQPSCCEWAVVRRAAHSVGRSFHSVVASAIRNRHTEMSFEKASLIYL